MNDIDFSYAMFGLLGVAAALYAARAVVRGRARHERSDRDGGSVFVGKTFMEFGLWLMGPVVAMLGRTRVTPNQVTALSLLPALGAGVAVSQGWFGLGCVLATCAALGDVVDGLLARRLGSASDAGEAIDAFVDRFGESFFMGGLVIYYRFSPGLCLLALVALLGAFMVSYSTAKAEALGVAPPRGTMRRAERAVYLMFAAALTPLVGRWVGPDAPLIARQAPMILALGLIGVVGNVSVVRRLRAIIRAINVRDGVKGPSARPPRDGSLAAPPSRLMTVAGVDESPSTS
jgi:phosphatidylglycerophosphate synthase